MPDLKQGDRHMRQEEIAKITKIKNVLKYYKGEYYFETERKLNGA